MHSLPLVWTRFAIVAVALAWAFVLIGGQCGLLEVQPDAANPNHASATSPGAELAVDVNHAHLSDNSIPPCPEQFAAAVLPQSAIPPIASVTELTAAASAGLLSYLVVSIGRGPHATFVSASAGQDILTRFCLSRR
ncbi:hypothetical protein [Mycobacterium sp.]|uniref:hypothetical protein n=1 Tax=Mycobacterium sp. TaxID=1785 RepID=UPI002CED259A|nr:hypothetical protein [Mycobacterium sp.]HTQ16228.1 hypothetical protein [Mycobacterium sp.]